MTEFFKIDSRLREIAEKAFLPVLPVTVMMTAAAKFSTESGARSSAPKIPWSATTL